MSGKPLKVKVTEVSHVLNYNCKTGRHYDCPSETFYHTSAVRMVCTCPCHDGVDMSEDVRMKANPGRITNE
jgi:hypothetical protein